MNINHTREPLEITGVNESTSLEMTSTPPDHFNSTIAVFNHNSTGVEEESQQGNQTTNTDTSHMSRHQMQLRPRHGQTNPTHLLGQGFEDEFMFLTAQMSAKKGLNMFGQMGADAIIAELQQIHYRKVVKPILAKNLSWEERRSALHYLMYLKQKRCGRIKARGCADRRKQRLWKTKEETSSPTVRTESVFLSAIIDSYENRHIVTCHIPGAFMQADIDEVVHVKFEGDIAKLLVKADRVPYIPYITYEHDKKTLVRTTESSLRTLQAALLFWEKLSQIFSTFCS